MALRFRRSIRLAPGLRLNLGKRGMSISTGVRGASMNFGPRGIYGNVGIPGTGLSIRERIGGARRASRRSGRRPASKPAEPKDIKAIINLNEDGSLDFRDMQGQPLGEALISVVKQERREGIRQWLAEARDKINGELEKLETIHLDSPAPDQRPVYIPVHFSEPEPEQPEAEPLGLRGRLFRKVRERIESRNQQARAQYEQKLVIWNKAREDFEAKEGQRKYLFEHGVEADPERMAKMLEYQLETIDWPRETLVSYEVSDDGKRVTLDVDLPEIEDMPDKMASLPARGWRLSMKPLSETRKRRLYMVHVHGIGFRLIGEVFASLPTVQTVELSAYSQRIDPATGHVQDQYLFSVQVVREAWSQINFHNLSKLDIVAALGRFQLRRKMSKTGIFRPIEPFSPSISG